MTNSPVLKIKKLLRIKNIPPFANIDHEIFKGNGAFKFYLIQTNSQLKSQVFFKPKRVHVLKNKKDEITPIECLMKDCPACDFFKKEGNLKHQFKSRFLYHAATLDQRFLLLDVGPNLHDQIQDNMRICLHNGNELFNNPQLILSLSEQNQGYQLDFQETLNHNFAINIQNNIDLNITLSEDKYLKLTKEEMLDLINWDW